MNPYFTVYVPAHTPEYASMAEVALASLELQTFTNFETIFIANDTAVPVWATNPGFVRDTVGIGGRKILGGCFGTLAAVANAAIWLARGRRILRLDADDELHAEALAHYAREIAVHPEAKAIEGHWVESGEIQGGGLVLPVDLLRQTGGYDETEPLKDGMRIIKSLGIEDHIIKTPVPVYMYHRHERSLSCP